MCPHSAAPAAAGQTAAADPTSAATAPAASPPPALDVAAVRAQFPILSRRVHDRPLVYFDNAASAQKPRAVLDAMTHVLETEYANVHRGLHYLSNAATTRFEAARGVIQRFLNAPSEDEVIFIRGATEGINLVASSFLEPQIRPGDEIVLTVSEHHANIVPWHFLRERHGAVLKWVDVDETGALRLEQFDALIGPRTKLVAFAHMSNTLGALNPAAEICALARAKGVPVLVDGSQAAVHGRVDVQALGCDFYVMTGHKLYGPTGSGALWAKAERLAAMRPYQGGGEMIREVTQDAVTFADPPHRFEAGTPAIVEMIGLAAALEWMEATGPAAIAAHEAQLTDYAMKRLGALNWITLYGTTPGKGPIIAFNVEGAHAHDVSTVVDRAGVAIRAGHHCAQPLMTRLGVGATARASFAVYNTMEEVDAFVDALKRCRELFQ